MCLFPFFCVAMINVFFLRWNGILLPKLFWPTVRKNCSSDWEKLLKFEAKGQKFCKICFQDFLTFSWYLKFVQNGAKLCIFFNQIILRINPILSCDPKLGGKYKEGTFCNLHQIYHVVHQNDQKSLTFNPTHCIYIHNHHTIKKGTSNVRSTNFSHNS